MTAPRIVPAPETLLPVIGRQQEPFREAIAEFRLLPWQARIVIMSGALATGAGAWLVILMLDALTGPRP